MKMIGQARPMRVFFYAIGVILVATLFLCAVLNFGYISGVLKVVISAFRPVLYALIVVFCVGGIVDFFYSFFQKKLKGRARLRKISRVLSIVLGYLTFLLIITALLVIVILPLMRSYSEVLSSIPQYIKGAKEWVRTTVESIPILSGQSDRIMEHLGDSLDLSYESISAYAPVLMEYINKIVSEASNMMLGLVISVYIICSREYIKGVKDRLLHAFISEDKANALQRQLRKVYGYFADFFSGRLLYCLVVGIIFYVVLWIMGVPLYSFISIMIGVLCFVPVIGVLSAFCISTFLVFITSYEDTGWFVLIYFIIMLCGNLLLQRFIIKEQVRVSISAALISVIVMTGLFGSPGTVVAIPVYLTLKLCLLSLLEYREQKKDKMYRRKEPVDESEGE